MKLKDIFPRYLLREKSYGELDLSGGSAFAHLAEGDGTGPYPLRGVHADVAIATVSDPENAYANSSVLGRGAYLGHFLHEGAVDPVGVVYELWADAGNGANPIFTWNEDGSFHWGDGTAAPDMILWRDGPYSISLATDTDFNHGGFEWWNEDESGDAYFYMFGQGGSAASIQFDTREDHPIIYASNRDGQYASLSVEGPDQWKIDGAAAGLKFGEDTVLRRASGAAGLVVDDGGADGFAVTPDGTLSTNYAILLSDQGNGQGGIELGASDGVAVDLRAVAGANGFVEIQQHGGGLRLNSPNGTAYNVTISNAGVVTATAA